MIHFTQRNRIWLHLMLVLLSMLSLSTNATVLSPAPDHFLWDKLLKKHVTGLPDNSSTQVSYSGFEQDGAELDTYLKTLSAIDQASFDSWSTADQLAFLLNAYNAWTVKLVLEDHESVDSIKDLGSLFRSPWKKKFIPLLGETRSLDDIEHRLIRDSDRYREPRIHFAANCASIGCPALRAEAYTGDKLNSQLEQQTRQFLSDKTRNRIEGKRVKISPIFKWYREDFETGWRGVNSVEDFLVRYASALGLGKTRSRQLQQGKMTVEFLEYDWRLNRQ